MRRVLAFLNVFVLGAYTRWLVWAHRWGNHEKGLQ